VEGSDLFVDSAPEPATASMLATIQSDIANLLDRRDGGSAAPLRLSSAAAAPDSIRIHSCHSPMREIEVLHDQLLALFDSDRTLEPRHVVVMAPAIDDYAPYIEAVFSADRSRPEIPYHIADRRPRVAERVVDAFSRILEVLRGRLTAPQVFDLLGMDVVRERFEIAARELDTVRDWIARAGIRWGVDESHRESEGQPPIGENTWRFGLERLLVGFAMPGEDRHLFRGVLPIDGVEGADGDLLGRFTDFCHALFSFRPFAERARTVAEWELDLGRLLARLIAVRVDTADQHRRIRRALETLTARAAAAGFDEPLHLEVFLRALDKEIGDSAAPVGFLSGGVTFCAMVPMRSIPFRVVCLLGMNDGAFPRTVRPPGFDLTTIEPKPGDRTRRDDDRYLFLETLLSARERLLISYVGQSIQDNSTIPPSVVVSELCDALAQSFSIGDRAADPIRRRAALAQRIVIRHALQSSSERYFRKDRADSRLFSYSETALESARARTTERRQPPCFVEGRLRDGAEAALPIVPLEDLERFFEHPSRWFCQRRLGLHLAKEGDLLEDTEPLEPSALEQWTIGDRLLRRLVDEGESADPLGAIRASGALPPGALGDAVYRAIAPQALRLAAIARTLADGERFDPLAVDVEIGGLRVSGFLRAVWPRGQVDWRFSKLGGRHELGLWVRHLFLQLVAPRDVPRFTFFVGRDENQVPGVAARFVETRDALATLESLVEI
ncbi:MAG: exodeoxyribonuclease V subunit gamma, partial [Candidatus Binatia bacterium]